MTLIWATCGKYWGYRFLYTGGYLDPLIPYEAAFKGFSEDENFRRVEGKVAIRFDDPEERHDYSGRIIVHEFLIVGPETKMLDNFDDAFEMVWPSASEHFDLVWNSPESPTHLSSS